MQITITFLPVSEGLPPVDPFPSYAGRYSIECIAVVNGEIFDRSIMYDFKAKAWPWADVTLREVPAHVPSEVPACA
jgi:hypothetical protein